MADWAVQVVEFPDVEGPLEFSYDEEWLSILQATHNLMSLRRQQSPLPGKHETVVQWMSKGISPFVCQVAKL